MYNCQLAFLQAHLPRQRFLIFKIVQIIYSALRKLIVMNSVSLFQALQLLTPFFRLQRDFINCTKNPVQTFKKYYLVLRKILPIWDCYHLSMLSQVSRWLKCFLHSLFKMHFYSKSLCLCKFISHVYSGMLISYLRSGIQLYLNYMPDGWAMHTFQLFDNLMNISLGKIRLAEHPKSSVTVVSKLLGCSLLSAMKADHHTVSSTFNWKNS